MIVLPKTKSSVVLCSLYVVLSTFVFINIHKSFPTRMFRRSINHTTDAVVPTHTLFFTNLVGKNYSSLPAQFKRAMSENETGAYLDLLVTLDRVTRAHNITMFMNYGTLLGSVRHHAFTPWDDDCDIAMPMKSKVGFCWTNLKCNKLVTLDFCKV